MARAIFGGTSSLPPASASNKRKRIGRKNASALCLATSGISFRSRCNPTATATPPDRAPLHTSKRLSAGSKTPTKQEARHRSSERYLQLIQSAPFAGGGCKSVEGLKA